MNDDRLLLDVRAWLQGEAVAVPDPDQAGLQIAARLPKTRQLRPRWWPMRVFDRTLAPPPTIPPTEFRPSPIPATNGHSPTVIGRTQSMFSPAKAIAAGALVFALGGALFIAQPFDRQLGGVPGAATDPVEPTTFTADASLFGPYLGGTPESIDGVTYAHDDFQMAVDATDPRASGTLTYSLNRESRAGAIVHAGTVAIENEGGSWAGTFTGYWDKNGARIFHAQLAGQDGYEGGTMLLDDVCACATPTSVMSGVIVPGDLPATE